MPKKQTLEEFIKKSNIAHNFKYNYDKSIYINKQTKVIVICPEHGDFEVTPGAHYILKSGCPECAKISRSKTKSKGLEKFIKQANLKWNSFYNYSKVNYINNYTKVEIICPIHGSFFKDPRSHIDPQRYGGCQSCSKERLSKIISKVQQQKPKGTNREAFIDYCNGIHNNKYSYDKMNYVNMMTPIEIICPIHGTFTQHPINHYQGKGCPECGKHIFKSKGEIEVREYIKSIYSGEIISNDRIQLGGKELDIYLPELKLAFEYDGTYWHDEASIKVKNPTKAEYAANKNYVDTQISTISQFDSSSDQTISGTWEFSKPLKITEAQLADEAVSKGYVDTNLSSKVDSTDVYTKTEIDNNYATKTEVADIKATADAAAPQATTYTKDEINTSLSNTVKITGDQTIAGVKTFTDNIKVPSPIAINDAASKDYVDALVDSVPLFNPAEAQTITGAYDFQDGLTRTTKDSPSTTDIMNKEMSDNLYIPKTSNSDIGGIKTFTDGIILADEKQLQLGTGTDALKIHGTGTGKAVIEGTNASELDIAVPVNIQENAHISTLSTDVTGLGKTILFRFKNDTASQDDMVLYMYGTTSLVGIQGSTLGGGFNVAKQGAVTCENSLLVRGGANFQSGVTLGQTLTVTGITTFLAVPQCSISPTATNQLTNKNYVDETIQQNINTTLEGVIKFASMTEAEYKALEVKSPSTIYYLTDVPLWVIGDQEIVTSNMPA